MNPITLLLAAAAGYFVYVNKDTLFSGATNKSVVDTISDVPPGASVTAPPAVVTTLVQQGVAKTTDNVTVTKAVTSNGQTVAVINVNPNTPNSQTIVSADDTKRLNGFYVPVVDKDFWLITQRAIGNTEPLDQWMGEITTHITSLPDDARLKMLPKDWDYFRNYSGFAGPGLTAATSKGMWDQKIDLGTYQYLLESSGLGWNFHGDGLIYGQLRGLSGMGSAASNYVRSQFLNSTWG